MRQRLQEHAAEGKLSASTEAKVEQFTTEIVQRPTSTALSHNRPKNKVVRTVTFENNQGLSRMSADKLLELFAGEFVDEVTPCSSMHLLRCCSTCKFMVCSRRLALFSWQAEEMRAKFAMCHEPVWCAKVADFGETHLLPSSTALFTHLGLTALQTLRRNGVGQPPSQRPIGPRCIDSSQRLRRNARVHVAGSNRT